MQEIDRGSHRGVSFMHRGTQEPSSFPNVNSKVFGHCLLYVAPNARLELVIGDTLILIDGKSTRFAEIWEEYSLNVVVADGFISEVKHSDHSTHGSSKCS